ncbi:hypothetical protein WJX72_009663 [[Myrmecia] bisecta]|uniref:histone acetyltransferase n=1 Tax=[Myrmecia] bisecta TaxID=41462 RepID=A0AAW1QS86_9CHLO
MAHGEILSGNPRQAAAETRATGQNQRQGSYEVGARVLCQASFDNTQRAAEVVGTRTDEEGGTVYYVHYVDCDKRLDEWVPASRLLPCATTAAAPVLAVPRLTSLPSIGSELTSSVTGDQKMTRRLKRRYDEIHHVPAGVEDLAPIDQHLEKEHQEKTKVKNIQVIELGKYEMDTWYYSPYPEPYASLDKLYVCEFSLKYFKKKKTLLRHLAKCELRHPPGDEIYRSPAPGPGEEGNPAAADPQIAVFEVDGKKNKVYCQSLCLLSKLFLDHKTLYYDVDPFLFYILCERDAEGYHVVGYFSKEKNSVEGYNLACILTLPPYQRKGYGRFLISFSYELSRKEGKIGTPERPLSDLGQVSYRSYWTRVVLDVLREHKGNLSIKDISEMTAIRTDDIVKTLESLNLIKYWKGDHIISVTPRIIEEHLKTVTTQKTIAIDADKLHWTPFMAAPLPTKK